MPIPGRTERSRNARSTDPEPGDTFTYENLKVEVLEAQSFRVDKLLVTLIPSSEEED